MDVWTAFRWQLYSVGSEGPPLGEPTATCKGCQVRHANNVNNTTIPSATLFFLNAYTSGTGEDRTWHRLLTSEVRVEAMPGDVSFSTGQEPMKWTRRLGDGVRCRRPVCIGRRLPWMTLSDVATLIIISRLAAMAPKLAACFSGFYY